jgi:hypothetical protein
MSEPRDISKEFTEAIRHWATWPQQLRKLCKSCNDEDLKRLMDFSIAFKDSRELKELNISQPGYYEVVREVIEERRHEEITKDAWVVKWTFWMVLVSILIALWACTRACLT